jgi:peptidoglycan lytic transglycosylase G
MKRIFPILGVIVLIFIATIYFFLKTNLKAVSDQSSNKIFVVEPGQGLSAISQKLEKNNLIRNNYAFIFHTFSTGQNKKIQAGTYRLNPSLSTPETVTKLTTGGVSDYWLKIPDGSRIEEIASLLPDTPYFTQQDFLQKAKNKEGYLFPDSYLFPEYFNLDQILEVIDGNFDKKFAQAKENSTSKLSDRSNLILASILEREGRSLESKQMITGILLNRLNINMALQVDASVQYAKDSQTRNLKKYWQPVTKYDLGITSLYNTYKNTGLPPTPICNPSYNSLYAVFHPIDSDYIYYITGNDGNMYYGKTLEEHNSNVSKYLR